jgi:Domain of unknown function DUF1828
MIAVMKEEICKAFCDDLHVRQTAAGYAISTPYESVSGEPIGFYAIGPDEMGRFRLVDDGATITFLEAAGASLDGSTTRQNAFDELLSEYGAIYDDNMGELRIPDLEERELPLASLRFMALLLRLRDLLLMTRERVESTFREDVINALRERLGGRATIKEEEPAIPRIADVVPDLLLEAPNHRPVALFIAQTDGRVNEAIYLQMVATLEAKFPLSVIAMLEQDSSVTRNLRQRADNRLDAVPRYRRDEHAAIERVAREVLGDALPPVQVH